MPALKSFRELLVWQKAMALAVGCYRIAKLLHREDQPVLGYQLRKSSVSIPSNIAEGFGRHHTGSYVNHLWIANGSANELQTQLELGQRLGLLEREAAQACIAEAQEVGRMLNGLIRSLDPKRRP